jgi:hypothetical protein
MKFKTNLVIGAIFLGLLAFVYFYEVKGGEKRRQEAEKSKQLLDFEDSEATRLVIDRGDTTVVLEKAGGDWKLTAPVRDRADQEAVERYLRNLRETEREKVIADSAAASGDGKVAARYGLDEPRLKVLLETEGGVRDTVLLGSDSPTDRYTYAQQRGANPEIFAMRAWRFDNLDKGAFDLRDRRVLAFDKDEVVEVRRERQGERAILVKEEGQWHLRQPLEARADKDEVDGLLNQIKNAQIEAFVAESADQETLAEYGLQGPAWLELSLLVGADRAEKRLSLGRQEEKGRFYARDASRSQVFSVDSTLAQKLAKGIEELRDKKPLRFARDRVARIELVNSMGQAIAAEKDTAGIWSIAAPEPAEAKSWKFNSLLTDLEQLEAEGFATSALFETARQKGELLHCKLLAEDGQVLLEARFAGAAEGPLYLSAAGDPSVYAVGKDDFAELDLKLDDVAQKPKPSPPAAADTGESDS